MAQTNTERLADLQAELAAIKTAISAILSKGQSATIGDKSLNRARLETLIDERNQLERDIQRLERGGRQLLMDMSVSPYGTEAADA